MRTCAALPHARDLGNAFQLTNMIRDIGEDPGPRNVFFYFLRDWKTHRVRSERSIGFPLRTTVVMPPIQRRTFARVGNQLWRPPGEDIGLNRQYMPADICKKHGVDLAAAHACYEKKGACAPCSRGLRLLLVVCAAGASSSAKESIAISPCVPRNKTKNTNAFTRIASLSMSR